ncbi:MAG: universal stress protein [Pseudomonadota bacterium]
MSEALPAPRKILAVVDADDDEQIALRSAMALAEAHGASLQLVACVEPPQDLSILARLSSEDPDRLLAEAAAHQRAQIIATLNDIMPGQPADLTMLVGKAFFEIIQQVAQSGCDFVVKKAEPLSGMDRFLFASTDQHLLRKCPCPVWLQTENAPSRPKRILAAVDLDIRDAAEPETLAALNRRVVEAACMLADGPDAEVTILHAWEALGEGMLWAFTVDGDARATADNYVQEILNARQADMDAFRAELGKGDAKRPKLMTRLDRGAPQMVIHEQCRALGADVIVMGTVARTGLSGVFIGNTAENIINSLDCPVLAVKPDGFVSPLLA